jgi:hypothetical protein
MLIASYIRKTPEGYVYCYRLGSNASSTIFLRPVNPLDLVSPSETIVSLGGGVVSIAGRKPKAEFCVTSTRPPCKGLAGFSLKAIVQSVDTPCRSTNGYGDDVDAAPVR